MKNNNTPQLETSRVILRQFKESDCQDMFELYSDVAVNRFLPWHPHQSIAETKKYLHDVVLQEYKKPVAYFYAIQLKATGKIIGYVVIHGMDCDADCGDLGYALLNTYRGQGIVAECCTAVLQQLTNDGFRYITATHDVNNAPSGRVMQKLGMQYKYSYVERWQPKNIQVTFRLYQLDLNGTNDTHLEYWNKYPQHFIENI